MAEPFHSFLPPEREKVKKFLDGWKADDMRSQRT
jgi:hypothetical protein